MASPHVAGAAAVLLAQNPTLTPALVAGVINANATPGLVVNAGTNSPNRLLFSSPTATTVSTSVPAAPTNVSAIAGKRRATVSWTIRSDGG